MLTMILILNISQRVIRDVYRLVKKKKKLLCVRSSSSCVAVICITSIARVSQIPYYSYSVLATHAEAVICITSIARESHRYLTTPIQYMLTNILLLFSTSYAC
jgi:hypothetical protein